MSRGARRGGATTVEGMTRVGGRNAAAAWVVGVLCAGVVAVLAVLALPLLPVGLAWLDGGSQPTSEPAADGDSSGDGMPVECRDLYSDALWGRLVSAEDSLLSPSKEVPTTSPGSLVDALQPTVHFTCDWTSADGTISTTFAEVPTDAGAIAKAALPAEGFECANTKDRVRCTLTVDDRVETIEAGGGLWLSTTQAGWHPSNYVDDTAERVWVESAEQ